MIFTANSGKPPVTFSDDQQAAIDAILDWHANGAYRFMTLGGYAGTGKTTVISHLRQLWPGVATCALCGKAAQVLRSKGVDATTIHRLIYEAEMDGTHVRFTLKTYLPGVKTIIVDEASMVSTKLYEDLLSFSLPVLFVGDHGQLEPIGDNPGLMVNPNVKLEKIHRQAMDNPILRLAHQFRNGLEVEDTEEDPRLTVMSCSRSEFGELVEDGWKDAQVICGFNKTRRRLNAIVRDSEGFADPLEVGERLVCLRNNYLYGCFNGQQFTVDSILAVGSRIVDVRVTSDDGESLILPLLRSQLGAEEVTKEYDRSVVLADYGYALTAHKSQGSEFDNVLAVEEVGSKWDPRRWQYTVATRAAKALTYCR